jgi:hypothetical protein
MTEARGKCDQDFKEAAVREQGLAACRKRRRVTTRPGISEDRG